MDKLKDKKPTDYKPTKNHLHNIAENWQIPEKEKERLQQEAADRL